MQVEIRLMIFIYFDYKDLLCEGQAIKSHQLYYVLLYCTKSYTFKVLKYYSE